MAGVSRDWRLFASHGVVLFYLAANPAATMREASLALGLTERQIARLVRDLVDVGVLRIERRGRRNFYHVDPDATVRDPGLGTLTLSRVVDAFRPAAHRADERHDPAS